MTYRVVVSPTARRQISRLPEKARAAIIVTLYETVASNPCRVGRRLSFELSGLLVARRGEYRIVYRVIDEERTVEILRAEHRRDVYRAR